MKKDLPHSGYLYIATDQSYIDEANRSVKSLRDEDPTVHTTLVTSNKEVKGSFDKVIYLEHLIDPDDPWKSGIEFKVKGLLESPYQKTFFLDTDTYFAESCAELFDLLDYYDLLIAPAPSDPSKILDNGRLVNGYFAYNTGVIVYQKNNNTHKLFTEWLKAYQIAINHYPHDQGPFMAALLRNPVHYYVLQPIYNFRTPFFVSLPAAKVKLIHGRVENYDRVKKAVNARICNRAWDPVKQAILHDEPSRVKLFRERINNKLRRVLLKRIKVAHS